MFIYFLLESRGQSKLESRSCVCSGIAGRADARNEVCHDGARGLTRRGSEQSPGVSSRVVGPLGCPSTQPALWQRAECGQAQGWERAPSRAVAAPGPKESAAFPNADAHHLS